MRRFVFALSFIFSIRLYAISIGDFTIKYQKNGELYNFYDNPARIFQIVGEKNTLDEIGPGYSNFYSYNDCSFNVLSRKFRKELLSDNEIFYLEKEFNKKNINQYYNISYFEAKQNFSTIRDVYIGDDIAKVLEKYPEAILYKNNGKYKWAVSDCYHETKIKKPKKLSDIGYVLLESANWQYNRSWEMDFPMHYELVFVIKDCKVKSIVMQYVLDAM